MLLREEVPVLVGQRCLDHLAGNIQKGSDTSKEADVFDTGSDSLADDVKSSFSGDLRTAGVS